MSRHIRVRVRCPDCGVLHCRLLVTRQWSHAALEAYRRFVLKIHREVEHRKEKAGGKQPKWQRARLLEDSTTNNGKTVVLARGMLLWVKTGPPVVRVRDSLEGGAMRQASYDTNVVSFRYSIPFIACPADKLELLARDENDFADEVTLIPLEEFLNQEKADVIS